MSTQKELAEELLKVIQQELALGSHLRVVEKKAIEWCISNNYALQKSVSGMKDKTALVKMAEVSSSPSRGVILKIFIDILSSPKLVSVNNSGMWCAEPYEYYIDQVREKIMRYLAPGDIVDLFSKKVMDKSVLIMSKLDELLILIDKESKYDDRLLSGNSMWRHGILDAKNNIPRKLFLDLIKASSASKSITAEQMESLVCRINTHGLDSFSLMQEVLLCFDNVSQSGNFLLKMLIHNDKAIEWILPRMSEQNLIIEGKTMHIYDFSIGKVSISILEKMRIMKERSMMHKSFALGPVINVQKNVL